MSRARKLTVASVATVAAGILSLGTVGFGGTAAAHSESCPNGWFLESAQTGDLFDKNGNGLICTKLLPAGSDGEGNSANSQRGDGQTGFHADGHNHKDDHVH